MAEQNAAPGMTNNPPAGAPPAGDPGQQPPAGNPPPAAPPATWDEYLATVTPEVKTLYEGHTAGLKSALQTERQQRSDLAKQINTLSKQAAEGSDLKKSLEGVQTQLEAATQRAEFFEAAVKPEIGCSNPSLAFIAARESQAIDQKGRINWDVLKQQFPELFAKKAPPPGNAGSGTQNPPAAKGDMNSFIRRQAGRE
jgi:hypothetical protein